MKTRASYHQERLWFIDKFETSTVYDHCPVYHNIPVILRLQGQLDKGRLHTSINNVVSNHEILRTRVENCNGDLLQVTSAFTSVDVPQIDLCDDSDGQSIIHSIERAISDSKVPFNLSSDRLIRACLYRLSEVEHLLLLTVHHIICDAATTQLLVHEIASHYKSTFVDPGPAVASYTDFSEWQRGLSGVAIQSAMNFWREQFKAKEDINLPIDRPRAAIHVYHEGRIHFDMDESTYGHMQSFCLEENVSARIPMLAAFKILLHRFTGQNSITVGTFAENRRVAETKTMFGPLANLVPLTSNFDHRPVSYYQFYRHISRLTKETAQYDQLPFERMVLELNYPNDMSRTALFDVLFRYNENGRNVSFGDNLEAEILDVNLGWGKYDMNLLIHHEEGISGTFVFNSDLFEQSTVEKIARGFKILLREVFQNPNLLVSEIPILDEMQRARLLLQLDSEFKFPHKETIHSLFNATCIQFPNRIAVVSKQNILTYNELNRRANYLAHILQNTYGVKNNELIGILLERSEKVIVAMLAVLKSGGAYVPIDPSYPESRINYILHDSECRVVITDGEIKEPPAGLHIIDLTRVLEEFPETGYEANPHSLASPEETAYVIYTSGTTGDPKGCMVSHRNVVQLMHNNQHPFHFTESDVWVCAHSFCFDFSVWEMYGALLYGGKLVIPDWETIRNVDQFVDFVYENKITVLNQTPPAFAAFIEEEGKRQNRTLNAHLRYVIFGGDKLVPATLHRWTSHYGLDPIKVINMYGITETTVHVTYHELTLEDINQTEKITSPIGRPLPGVQVFVMDRYFSILPEGVVGELYVGGAGLSKGYWKKKELTDGRFVLNPHLPGELMYKTGDLGKWNDKRLLEFCGRNDKQVKIRGFRIELGEIEQKLNAYPHVEKAVVMVRQNDSNENFLVGFVVLEGKHRTSAIKDYLKTHLPEYMIPPFLLKLDSFPLTFNGKINYRALQEMSLKQSDENIDVRTEPKTPTEFKLIKIWSEILGTPVTPTMNFFEVGGHSLMAVRIISGINNQIGVKVDLKTFFLHPTISELAEIIEKSQRCEIPDPEPLPSQSFYELSHAQKRLWLACQFNTTTNDYNVPYTFEIIGDLQRECLEESVALLINRHEILRTNFVMHNELPVQRIMDSNRVKSNFLYRDVQSDPRKDSMADDLLQKFSKTPFNLETDAPVRALLIKKNDQQFLFSLVLHHLVCDAWSAEILLSELSQFYSSLVHNTEIKNLALKIQYKEYAAWHNAIIKTERMKVMRQYWTNKFGGVDTLNDLPYDYVPALSGQEGGSIAGALDPLLYNEIRKFNQANGTSSFMVLLAAVKVLIFRYTRAQVVVVGSPVTGRSHKAFEQLIGFFSNTLLFKTTFSAADTLLDTVLKVRDEVLDAFSFSEYPYDLLADELQKNKSTTASMLFNTGFTWHSSAGVYNKTPDIPSLTITPYKVNHYTSITPLWFHGYEKDNTLCISIDYDKRLFKKTTIEIMLQRIKITLAALKENPATKLVDIELSIKEKPSKKEITIGLHI
jgi:amino acid adenylation domain-containing protein